MTPLDPIPDVARALSGAPAAAVRAAIDKARASGASDARHAAAVAFAEGALLLRSGSLEAAGNALEAAEKAFAALGEEEAAALSRIEAHTARVRRGMHELAIAARDDLAVLETTGTTERVRIAALLIRGTAERILGEAARAHAAFLRTLEESGRLPDLRSQALNSLGTLYVVTGALAAAVPNLERAAELCHARGDVIGEAIAMGQLGAAALGLGDLHGARRYLSRQEFLARSVGDAFGCARALVWLAEVALSLGSPNDAIDIADRARKVADDAGLTTWGAYANRIAGRARRERGESGRALTEAALEVFRAQKLPLGEALCTWDLAVATDPPDSTLIRRALSIFASLGLPDRAVDLLLDLRRASELVDKPSVEVLLATVGLSGRRAEVLEAELVHDDPVALALVAGSRTSAKRNLARLALLSTSPQGLVVLAVRGVSDVEGLLADRAFLGTLIGEMGDVCLFGWSLDTAFELVEGDVGRLVHRAPGAGGAFSVASEARVVSPGHGGGTGARFLGVDVSNVLRRALDAEGITMPAPWRTP